MQLPSRIQEHHPFSNFTQIIWGGAVVIQGLIFSWHSITGPYQSSLETLLPFRHPLASCDSLAFPWVQQTLSKFFKAMYLSYCRTKCPMSQPPSWMMSTSKGLLLVMRPLRMDGTHHPLSPTPRHSSVQYNVPSVQTDCTTGSLWTILEFDGSFGSTLMM